MDPKQEPPCGDPTRAALARLEARAAEGMPPFAEVWARVLARPSPLVRPPWGARRRLRAAAALLLSQLRVAPWLMGPVALLAATLAVFAARFFEGGHAAARGFVMVTLLGGIITVSMSLSTRARDGVSLTTPIGPRTVLLSRVVMALTVNLVSAVCASWAASALAAIGSPGALIAVWFAPLICAAGLVTFVSVSVAPWLGAVVGILALPWLTPAQGDAARIGLGGLIAGAQEAVPAVAVAGLGCVFLTLGVLLARRPLLKAHPAS